MTDNTYNGWSNRATWAMGLNLSNEYDVYKACENLARFASWGNEDNEEAFHEELAESLEKHARDILDQCPSLLPDFDPDSHMSPDPKDNHGPDDIDDVNWLEIAEGYDLEEYV